MKISVRRSSVGLLVFGSQLPKIVDAFRIGLIIISLSGRSVFDNGDDRFTIEHVWPQSVSDEFLEHLHETINENSDRLGNLALMTIEDNAGNQNDPFEKKKASFDESKFRMLNEILENDEWTLDHIEDRETRILNVIKSRWPDTVAQEADSVVPTAEDDRNPIGIALLQPLI